MRLCEGQAQTGQTYHLTAGSDACTMGEVAVLASKYFRRPLPKVVSLQEFAQSDDVMTAAALESSRAYFPYFSISTVFDNGVTRTRLAQAGIHSSPLGDYMERLLDFATRSRWGKRPIERFEALAPGLSQ